MTTPIPRAELRAQLLLHLPDAGLRRIPAADPAGRPSDVAPGSDLFDQHVPLAGYDPLVLADWILAQFDALELSQVTAIEAASAAGVLSASVEFRSYLIQMAAALRSGLDLVQQRSLAAAVDGEAERLSELARQVLAEWPHLLELPSAASVLVAPDGTLRPAG